ncbi:hypothetical protein ACT1UH_02885 [Mycoplasma sp. 332]|uniref:hypothetical protein n=1 Tax=Mycoplasma sp. 332 TaxID=3458236 RepID=UPI0040364BAE
MNASTLEQNKFKKIDWNKIFSNQINTLYEPLAFNIKPALDKIFEEEVYKNNENEIKIVDENINKIKELEQEIIKNKKENKINSRKFVNGLIIFLFFLIIGLFFIRIFNNNKKTIKDFKEFKSKKLSIIQTKINENNSILATIFNKYSMLEWKNKVLALMDIKKIYGICEKEFSPIFNRDDFYGFSAIEKYKVRNSYFYDVLYNIEEWRDVVTRGVGYITVRTKDSWVEEAVYAYHTEPTPFIVPMHALNIPTNYRSDLSFIETREYLNEKEYNKLFRKGEFLLERPEFYKNYNFNYDNQIGFIDYFKVKTQENFINYAQYFGYPGPLFSKYKNNILLSRVYNEEKIGYSSLHNWMGFLFDLNNPITIGDIYSRMLLIIANNLIPVFKAITKAYLNPNIASEKYEKRGERYLSDYVYEDASVSEDKTDFFNYFDVINKAITGNKFSMKTKDNARELYVKYVEQIIDREYKKDTGIKRSNALILKISIDSYWKEQLIDEVYKSGIIIKVPFERFHLFTEEKFIIWIPSVSLNEDNDFVSYGDLFRENSISNSFMDAAKYTDKYLAFNKSLHNNRSNELDDCLLFVNRIKKSLIANKDYKISIDSNGTYIYINEKISEDEINKIFAMFR